MRVTFKYHQSHLLSLANLTICSVMNEEQTHFTNVIKKKIQLYVKTNAIKGHRSKFNVFTMERGIKSEKSELVN